MRDVVLTELSQPLLLLRTEAQVVHILLDTARETLVFNLIRFQTLSTSYPVSLKASYGVTRYPLRN